MLPGRPKRHFYRFYWIRIHGTVYGFPRRTLLGSSLNKLVLCSRTSLHTTGTLHRTKLDFREPRIPEARFPRRTLLKAFEKAWRCLSRHQQMRLSNEIGYRGAHHTGIENREE